jgi:hypothetical protein
MAHAQDKALTIDLDKIPSEKLLLTHSIDDNGQPLFFDIFTNITYDPFVNKIYLAERAKLSVLTTDGKIIKKLARRGQGPGEFSLIKRIVVDTNRIFIADLENSNVQILNKDFSYLKSIPINGAIKDIAYLGNNQMIIHTIGSDGNILHKYDLNAPYRPIESFAKVINKFDGILGNVLTINHVSITNNNGCVYALYRVLPVLRIFCKTLKQPQELHFSGKPIEPLYEKLSSSIKTTNPSAIPVKIFSTRILVGSDGLIYWLSVTKKHKKVFAFDSLIQNWKVYSLELDSDGEEENMYIDFCLVQDSFYLLNAANGIIQVYRKQTN